jgi:periplasmic protein TonB
MNNQYALPIAAALALHVSLAFGFRHPASPPANTHKPATETQRTVALVPLVEPPDPVDATEAPKGTPKETPTDARERPPLPAEGPIVIPVPVTFGPVLNRKLFDIDPPGVPNGDPLATRTSFIYSAAGLDKAPSARTQLPPGYPHSAKQAGLSGEVVVEFLVDETGAVSHPVVIRSSDRVFEEASLRAVLKWRFEPGRRDGRIVRFRMAVPVVFRLNDT